jgi:ketosteroid isomerase-like protein
MDEAANNLADIERAIAAHSRAFEAQFAAKDAAGLVESYYVPDVLDPAASGPGGQRPITGKRALTAMFETQMRDFSAIRLETVRVEAVGSMAFEMGRAHLTTNDGQSAVGRYCVLWRHIAGEWRAQVDFFAADGW